MLICVIRVIEEVFEMLQLIIWSRIHAWNQCQLLIGLVIWGVRRDDGVKLLGRGHRIVGTVIRPVSRDDIDIVPVKYVWAVAIPHPMSLNPIEVNPKARLG